MITTILLNFQIKTGRSQASNADYILNITWKQADLVYFMITTILLNFQIKACRSQASNVNYIPEYPRGNKQPQQTKNPTNQPTKNTQPQTSRPRVLYDYHHIAELPDQSGRSQASNVNYIPEYPRGNKQISCNL
ncbi:MAG: hypothetical protein KFE20_00540 [Candidatus Sulcia muelleri]|nr:hypothetical protein [Candidatus Karelsulcia muelleri]